MSETGPGRKDIGGILQELRREFAGRAEQAGTIEAIAGGPVDSDLPPDYWGFSDADLENELWSRIPELDQALRDLDQAMRDLDRSMIDLDPAIPDLDQSILDLDRAMGDQARSIDILPSLPLPAGPGLSGKIKGGLKNLLVRLVMPLIRITLEKQDRLNRLSRITLEKQDRLNRLIRITLEKQDRLNRLSRITVERQDRLNGQFKHLQFILFLTVRQLRLRLQRLEGEGRELGGRLAELEAERDMEGEASERE